MEDMEDNQVEDLKQNGTIGCKDNLPKLAANYIAVDQNNVGEFFGPYASRYSYVPELRRRVTELYQARMRDSANQYFVLDGNVCIAAQATLNGAMNYMNDSRVLVLVA